MIGEVVLQRLEQFDPALSLSGFDVGRRVQVVDAQLRITFFALLLWRSALKAVGGANGQRGVTWPQKSGLIGFAIEDPIRRDADEARQRSFSAGEFLRDRRTQRRIPDRAGRLSAGAHQVGAASVVPFFGSQTADDRQMLGVSGQLGQMLAELQPRYGGVDRFELAAVFVFGFHVEGVGLRGSTDHPQQNVMMPAIGFLGQRFGQSRHPATEDRPQQAERRSAEQLTPRETGRDCGSSCPGLIEISSSCPLWGNSQKIETR